MTAPLLQPALYQLRLFFIALQFFTRLPIPRWVGFDPAWLHHAARYFPAVGIVVGAVAAGVYWLAALLWSPAIAVLLSTAAGIYLTGAFHEDGLADMCDGFGGGSTPARVLEIMQDSRIGAYGAIGIVLMLGLKCVALGSLPTASVVPALLIAHPLSRLAAVSLIWRMAYAKAQGKAKPLAQTMSNLEFLIAASTVGIVVLVVLYCGAMVWGVVMAGSAAALIATCWLARKCVVRIGGFTGDCLGAVQQVAELAFYLGMLAAMRWLPLL
ncbi:MAG: adenosylcobinamide-GDP ribazoletransferase [Pseudomonadota bacterium]